MQTEIVGLESKSSLREDLFFCRYPLYERVSGIVCVHVISQSGDWGRVRESHERVSRPCRRRLIEIDDEAGKFFLLPRIDLLSEFL